jgi:hypothetical protein
MRKGMEDLAMLVQAVLATGELLEPPGMAEVRELKNRSTRVQRRASPRQFFLGGIVAPPEYDFWSESG